jgi:hypothetical protein
MNSYVSVGGWGMRTAVLVQHSAFSLNWMSQLDVRAAQ